ncbi:mRNA-decapping enzyme-like protein [Tanacetum coccineum]
MSQKLTPNIDEKSTKVLNLTVLQRMDPYIEEILITAAHVTLYDFNVDLNQWSRKDVEGSLFVVKRNAQPRFQFIVMNRRNTENLVENLLGDFEFELQAPYLLYRNPVQEVNGIWFYNSRECEDVANLFTSVFEELETVPTSAVAEGPLEPPYATSNPTDIPEDSSFMNFFSNAMNLGHNSSNSTSSAQPYHNSSNSTSSVQPYHNSTTIPLSSRVTPSPVLNGLPNQISSSASSMPLHENTDLVNSRNGVANLIKPLSFYTPASSSPVMLQPTSSSVPVTASNVQQRNHGVPLLQPFPPPTPPLSLTPMSMSPQSYGPLTREKVRDALVLLAQNMLCIISCLFPSLEVDKLLCINRNLYTACSAPVVTFHVHAVSAYISVMAVAYKSILSNLLLRSSNSTPPAAAYNLISRRGIASRLYVAGLSFYTTEKALQDAFSQFGQVVEANVMMDKVSSRSKGFGFVTYASADEAEKAISEMDGKTLHGRVICVELAKPRTPINNGVPIARGPPEPPTTEQV